MIPTCPITYALTAFNNANHNHFDLIQNFFAYGHKAELKDGHKENAGIYEVEIEASA